METLFAEPLSGLIEQWPIVAIVLGILWFMRRDLLSILAELRECRQKHEAIIDRLLGHFDNEVK